MKIEKKGLKMSEESVNEEKPAESLKYSDFFNDQSNQSNGNHEMSCRICGEKFQMVGILEVHMSKVQKCEPMAYCDECGTGFKRRMGMILLLIFLRYLLGSYQIFW